ncbi:TauD/TfdA family dioxygenase [Alphaproteobacteria bacterium]|nr:TauD/TfdA family dioxygenase [Alphaproteobacteria bacterium]
MSTMSLHPLTGACGAEVSGVSLNSLSNEAFSDIHDALVEYGALFFRDQHITLDEQVAFGRRFGALEVHPIVDGMKDAPEITRVLKPAGESASFGTGWHTDNSFFAEPSMGSVLYGKTIPPFGGDTLFANQYLAYDRLSDAMKAMLDGLNAVHSASRAYTTDSTKEKYAKNAAITYTWDDSILDEVIHPVVRTHPVTKRKALYVNDMFTLRFEGMSEAESQPLLSFLFQHATKPEFCCRFRWTENTVAIWDNRCMQHYAVDDYKDYERLMFRVTIEGDKPF